MEKRIINPDRPIHTEVMETSWTATKITGLLHCVQQYWYNTHTEYIPKELLPPEPPHLVQGVILHEWAESYLKGKKLDWDLTTDVAKEVTSYFSPFQNFLDNKLPGLVAGVIGPDFEVEVERGLSLNPALKPLPYKQKNGKLFAGKIDYLAVTKNEGPKDCVVVDYKSTKNVDASGGDHELQMAMYKLLLAKHMPVNRIATAIYFIRQDRFEWVSKDGNILVPYNDADVKSLIKSHMDKARQASQGEPRQIGSHCAFCRYKNVCH